MHLTQPIFIFPLISLIISLIHFASAESASSPHLHVKKVKASIEELGNGEVATQPGHILSKKDASVLFPSDEELLRSLNGFASLVECRLTHSEAECNIDLAKNSTMFRFGTSLRDVFNCRLDPDGLLCSENGDIPDEITAISSFMNVPSPMILAATDIGTRTVTETGTFTMTGTFLSSIETFTDLRGSTIESLHEYASTETLTGTVTSTTTFTYNGDVPPTSTATLTSTTTFTYTDDVSPTSTPEKRRTPMMKRADEMQQDAKATLSKMNDDEVGFLISLIGGIFKTMRREGIPATNGTISTKRGLDDDGVGLLISMFLSLLREGTPVSNGTTTALAAAPSATDSSIPSATPVPLTKRPIPAAIAQDPQTPSATAVPTPSAVSFMDHTRKGAIGGALGAALPNIIANAAANGITTAVEDSTEEGADSGPEDDDSEEVDVGENEDEKKRSIQMAVNVDPILGDDLLSGGLVTEESNAAGGELGETWKWDKGTPVLRNGPVGVAEMVGRRRVRYNGAQATRTIN